MKLRTEMFCTEPGDALLAYDADCGLSPERQAEHDAMAAHALLQAQDEFWKRGDLEDLDARDAVEAIGARAAEILAGWLGEEAG